jgi:hypothetical protein
VSREVRAQLIAIGTELIRNGREKNLRRHERASTTAVERLSPLSALRLLKENGYWWGSIF